MCFSLSGKRYVFEILCPGRCMCFNFCVQEEVCVLISVSRKRYVF